jgi:hypothetical protein
MTSKNHSMESKQEGWKQNSCPYKNTFQSNLYPEIYIQLQFNKQQGMGGGV